MENELVCEWSFAFGVVHKNTGNNYIFKTQQPTAQQATAQQTTAQQTHTQQMTTSP